MNEFKPLKDDYDTILIPNDYDTFIDQAIHNAKPKKHFLFYFKIAFATSFCFYVIALNTIPTFAKTMLEIPVIKEVSKVFCFNTFDEVSKTKEIHIEVPHIKNTGNSELERKVNNEIQAKIDAIVKQVELDAKELEQNYDNIYDESFSYIPANVYINYEVYFQNDATLSFVIKKVIANASSLSENYVYNYDLKNGEKITLESLLGKHYKTIVDTQIQQQIKQKMKEDKNAIFFDGKMGFQGIQETQKFYINKDGYIVILFDKYEIAPGYMGDIQFVLKNKINAN